MKPLKFQADTAAASIRFGVEIETVVPLTCGVSRGVYHRGNPVATGHDEVTGAFAIAPTFRGQTWRADSDASICGGITADGVRLPLSPGTMGIEFVSPILEGEAGLQCVRDFLKFLKTIGAAVNGSTGLHITVGIASVTGTVDAAKNADFCRRLIRIARRNEWAIYAQTGTNRHENYYAHRLNEQAEIEGRNMVQAMKSGDVDNASMAARRCGRGMVNFQKAFRVGTGGAVEFRAFAGTLNEGKLFVHLATALGICRKAWTMKNLGSTVGCSKSPNAMHALQMMFDVLGWGSYPRMSEKTALGLFGFLYSELPTFAAEAERMAEKFESRFPGALRRN